MRSTYLIPLGLVLAFCVQTHAQAPPAGQAPAKSPAPVRPSAYPTRAPADPAVVARGKATFGVHCSFCHGSDARGGEGGPNLIRSELVLNDKDGEKIGPVILNGRLDRGMPKFDLSAQSITDIATFVHSFRVGGYDISRQQPMSILVGDAKAGQTYFGAKCASCHSVTGDLKGTGAKFSEAKALQQTWLAPGGAGRRGPGAESPATAKPVTVTVTLPSGEKADGRLVRIDDFIVILTKEDGTQSSFRRDGDSPKVEVHDPAQPHRDLLATYTDKDIHNLTAYLVTLK